MSFAYTEKIKPIIIGLLKEGRYTLADIAMLCNVSTQFVRKVAEGYDSFYTKLSKPQSI